MHTLINLLTIFDLFLAILLFVAGMARMDQRYAAKVRAEQERKAGFRTGKRDYFR